ncbi:MAG: transcription elongation factor GreA [Phascolarctobacterium sp.]|nr:transcription elongation factor GreA [Phascolarctobacterium sp.]MBR5588723.1 transcription elongation factor GreA [Phascolarctobacterium sp.]MBR5791122.1 transcription elongation factor GreA [Phascolarctobacterium sp.]MBR5857544.1 transcription elongation factor GreA [Phascolarctobacterium sp.]
MATKETILTAEGLIKLEEELNNLRTVRRQEVAERLKVAISYGDISENSEYDDAKSEQAFIEGRILELEQMINTATIIDDTANKKKGVVGLGSVVVVKDMETGEEEVYTIVGTTEADPFENRISNESPVGAAILGQKVNTVVQVNTPVGELAYKIVKVD